MVFFSVGPSQLHASLPGHVDAVLRSGMLSRYHRSEAFRTLMAQLAHDLKQQLAVPADYAVWLLPSATAFWAALATDATQGPSVHVASGAFGNKWHQHAEAAGCTAQLVSFSPETAVEDVLGQLPSTLDVLCLTDNETSNGTRLPLEMYAQLRRAHPEALIAVDAVSSLAGVAHPYAEADLWFASVQKCLGLPAGLAVAFASPRMVARVEQLRNTARFDSLYNLHRMAQQHQTVCTPNMLGIALLARRAAELPPIASVDAHLRQRAEHAYAVLDGHPLLSALVQREASRSGTVVAVTGRSEVLKQLKASAGAHGFELSGGYGPWKDTTLRVANFPAIADADFYALWELVERFRG